MKYRLQMRLTIIAITKEGGYGTPNDRLTLEDEIELGEHSIMGIAHIMGRLDETIRGKFLSTPRGQE